MKWEAKASQGPERSHWRGSLTRGAAATLKVSSLCPPATDVLYLRSKLSLHALITHYGECTGAFAHTRFKIIFICFLCATGFVFWQFWTSTCRSSFVLSKYAAAAGISSHAPIHTHTHTLAAIAYRIRIAAQTFRLQHATNHYKTFMCKFPDCCMAPLNTAFYDVQGC